MKMISKVAVGVGIAVCCAGASAQMTDGKAGEGPNPYSNCGIGGAIFPTVSWAAATSNVIWDLGTTAVSSATLSPETCNSKTVAMAEFIQGSYASLETDILKGRGDYLTGLSEVSGCSGEISAIYLGALRTGLKQNYKAEFVNASEDTKGANLFLAAASASEACSA